ncbi:MAG: CDP-glucose 4,6-dehydratase, partial [Flavitalea sp.]
AISCWGSGTWEDVSGPGQPHEAGLLKLDIGLAIEELKWTPKFTASEAIRATIDWYRKPIVSQTEFTFQQITEYFT